MNLNYVKNYNFSHDMTDGEIYNFIEEFLKCDKETFSEIFLYLLDNFIPVNISLSNINVKKILKNKNVKLKFNNYYPTDTDKEYFISL